MLTPGGTTGKKGVTWEGNAGGEIALGGEGGTEKDSSIAGNGRS